MWISAVMPCLYRSQSHIPKACLLCWVETCRVPCILFKPFCATLGWVLGGCTWGELVCCSALQGTGLCDSPGRVNTSHVPALPRWLCWSRAGALAGQWPSRRCWSWEQPHFLPQCHPWESCQLSKEPEQPSAALCLADSFSFWIPSGITSAFLLLSPLPLRTVWQKGFIHSHVSFAQGPSSHCFWCPHSDPVLILLCAHPTSPGMLLGLRHSPWNY